MVTTGKRRRSWWRQRLARWNFTLRTLVWLVGLAILLLGALLDVTFSAREKEQRVQESELRGELAQFLLSISERDGSSLLENPAEFSAVFRPLKFVSLRRSFFTYVLQTGNARGFKTGDISFEAPRACQVEFQTARGMGEAPENLHACFAVVPGDQTGRYVYFSLRYPTSKIQRHRAGRPLSDVNRVVLTFSGLKDTRITLAYQVPPLARMRYPSQLARFSDVHEISGFVSNEGGIPSRLVNGQAFERQLEEDGFELRNFVTIVGRLDAGLFLSADSEDTWPPRALKDINIGVMVYDGPDGNNSRGLRFDVPPGTAGRPLVSLTQAYLASVPSRASLKVVSAGPNRDARIVWRSDDAGLSQSTTRLDGLWQRLADKWADVLITRPYLHSEPVSVSQPIQVNRLPNASATLTSAPFMVPDLAARALIWISGALFVILLLSFAWGRYLLRLRRISSTAFKMVVHPNAGGDLRRFKEKDELGTLAQVFHVLLKRNRARDLSLVQRLRAEQFGRAEQLRLAEAHVANRKSILDAIGHEIRAPLQSLLNSTKDQAAVQNKLGRIRRAVDALYEATSVEDGLRSGEIAMSPHDLAVWLKTFASNLAQDNRGVIYVGPESGINVDIDSFLLEQILDNLIDNAERHRVAGTDIELRLVVSSDAITLQVYNQGSSIPEAHLKEIFELGVSDSEAPGNAGLGLFASRIYGLAMNLTLHAENLEQGVSLVLRFPRSTVQRAQQPQGQGDRGDSN